MPVASVPTIRSGFWSPLTSPITIAVVVPGCGPKATVSLTRLAELLTASEKVPVICTPGSATVTVPPTSPARPPAPITKKP